MRVICGDKELPVTPGKIIIHSDSPGTTCIGKDDLFDLGFRVDEIDEAGKVTLIDGSYGMAGYLELEIRKYSFPDDPELTEILQKIKDARAELSEVLMRRKKESMIKRKNKYLVRPSDSMVFEKLDGGLYQGTRGATDDQGNKPLPYDHFTFENLTRNYDFFPIEDDQVQDYETKCDEHYQNLVQETLDKTI